jgi:tRNA-dihydrouridine synthase 1
MSAEGQLYNAALFARTDHKRPAGLPDLHLPQLNDQPSDAHPSTSDPDLKFDFDDGLHPAHADLALEYLDIVKNLKTPTAPSAVKGHLFKLLRPALAKETDLRHVRPVAICILGIRLLTVSTDAAACDYQGGPR